MNTLSKYQIISIIIIGILLVGGAALVQNRRVSRNEVQGVFSTDVSGLPEAKPSQVVEFNSGDSYNIVASIVQKTINGQPVKMLAYNGSIPGPLIKVKKDTEITINFTNNTDVETALHSHGVRLDNAFDGTSDTQKLISVGGSFVYKIKFPDVGMYWYHPHVREDYAQELGLYGNFLVVSDDPNYWQPVNREVPLMIDDILMENGKIAPFDRLVADHALMGRFGNVMLVNGETDYKLNAKQGEVVRFYFTNTASTRVFNVAIPNANMKLVGADGGKYEREVFVDSVIISPSERAIVEVSFDAPGTYTIQHKAPDKTYVLGTINVSALKAVPSYIAQSSLLRTNQDIIASIDPFRSFFAKVVDKKLVLTIDMAVGNMMAESDGHNMHIMDNGQMMSSTMMGDSNNPIEWEDGMVIMNQMSTTQMMQWKITDQDTGKSNMDINWQFKVGDKVKVSIFNNPNSMHPMQHPIHFHGQRFLVLSTNGVKNDNLVWKDTGLVGSGETVELLIDMENPGTWMAHCHIAEHLEDGMMFRFTVSK